MRKEWMGLCDRLGLGSETNYALFEEIYQKYTESHRFYHDLNHIWSRLGEVQKHNDLNLELAWWFHDSIYDPTKKDNELQSSGFAYKMMYAMGVQENERLEVHRLIMCTQHNCLLSDPIGQIIADIDLLGLADDRFTFDDNSANIRKEFSMYSDEEYKKGRLEFLENFCKRSKIYYTKTYSDYYDREGTARKNLAREIERLRA
jgi:predicted metal-dependent HD superfamily phosphohydrolase